MKNERGSTLLLVLAIIAVVTTLGIVLSSMTMTSRIQLNKTDRHTVATDLAEMGITYIDTKIKKITKDANQLAKEQTIAYMNGSGKNKPIEDIVNEYNRLFCERIRNTELSLPMDSYNKTFEVEQDRSFKLTKQFGEISSTECQIKNEIPLKFYSTGTDGTDSKSIEVIAYLTKSNVTGGSKYKEGDSPPPIEDFKTVTVVDFSNKEPVIIDESAYFENNVDLSQGNDKLIVQGEAYFSQELDMNGNSTLKIYGDAFFSSPINEERKDGTKSYNVCVKGNTFLIVDGKLVSYTIDPKYTASCDPFPIDESDLNMDWTSEEKDIKVSY